MGKKKKFMCALGNCKKQCFTCSEDEKCDKHWGGKRIGSGRKPAPYQTQTIAFRVRFEFVEPIKKMVKDYVKAGVSKSFCECGSQKDHDCKYCTSCNRFESV